MIKAYGSICNALVFPQSEDPYFCSENHATSHFKCPHLTLNFHFKLKGGYCKNITKCTSDPAIESVTLVIFRSEQSLFSLSTLSYAPLCSHNQEKNNCLQGMSRVSTGAVGTHHVHNHHVQSMCTSCAQSSPP